MEENQKELGIRKKESPPKEETIRQCRQNVQKNHQTIFQENRGTLRFPPQIPICP
jgi:hypothetical protein